MSEQILTGLDGKNPIAFLAALGALNAVSDRAGVGKPSPELAWRQEGTFLPVLVGVAERKALLDLLWEDVQSFRGEPSIERLRYQKEGGAEAHDLKPPPGKFAEYLRGLVEGAGTGGAGRPRRSLDFAAAFATDVAVDNNGNTKPTALHFTAGQQEFLSMVAELIVGLTPGDMEEAVFGPWRYERPLPVLQWDNAASRDYALRASDPSKEKKLGVPGADWLAFRGLPFLKVAPAGDAIFTTGCRGRWKTGTFRWPMWTVPLSRPVIGSMLASPELESVEPRVLRARGVAVVFESGIRRSDQGGYGSFTPARVA
jgi:hypothetical protein